MPIVNHIDVLTGQTLSNDSAATTQSKINANTALAESEGQKTQDRLENTASYLCGEGFLTLPVVTSSGSSLQITFTACKVLIGCYLALPSGAATLLASQASGVLYLNNDLTFSTTLPTTKSYMIFGTYVTDGSGVTTFTLSSKLLIPKLVTVTDTITGIVVPDDTDVATGYVDHSADAVFAVDGLLTLNVDPNSDFTVEELYAGSMIDVASDFAHTPLHQRTNEGFHYKISRKAGAYYAEHATADLTYSRTGFILAQ